MHTPKKQSIRRTCHPCQKPESSKKQDFTNHNGVNRRHKNGGFRINSASKNTFTKRKFTNKPLWKEIHEENISKKKSYEEKKLQKWVRDNPIKMTRDLCEMKYAKKCRSNNNKSLEIMLTKEQKNRKFQNGIPRWEDVQKEETLKKIRRSLRKEPQNKKKMVLPQRNHAKIRRWCTRQE